MRSGVSGEENKLSASLMLALAEVGLPALEMASKYFDNRAAGALAAALAWRSRSRASASSLAWASASFRRCSSSCCLRRAASCCSILAFSAAACASIAFFLLLQLMAQLMTTIRIMISRDEFRIAFICLVLVFLNDSSFQYYIHRLGFGDRITQSVEKLPHFHLN